MELFDVFIFFDLDLLPKSDFFLFLALEIIIEFRPIYGGTALVCKFFSLEDDNILEE